MSKAIPAPGARIVIRDAQWLVRRVESVQGGGYVIHCTGLSDIVRDREMRFLSNAEQSIEILDPASTRLVQDDSSSFSRSLLYLESLLHKTVPSDGRIYCGHRAAMDALPFQLEPAAAALAHPRRRILIADTVGLGKTLECGIILSELIRRGQGRRILVVTVKSVLTQFQKEMWSRFSIPLTRLDSEGLKRIREQIPENHNPFHYYDRSIISIDTLKSSEYRHRLQNAWWDVIVIDEAHNVAERRGSHSERSALARSIARRCDSLVMLSATPHDGSARSFASLMNMLDPTAIADPDHYGPDDIRGLFIRRFKKDVKDQLSKTMHDREVSHLRVQASPVEEAVYDALTQAAFPHFDGRQGAHLYRIQLEKSMFSSPAACLETVENSLRKLRTAAETVVASAGGRAGFAAVDIASLERIRSVLQSVAPGAFSKYGALLKALKDSSGSFFFTGKSADRLVIFTERIATLDFLAAHLPEALGLKKNQWTTLRGEDSDIDQQKVVEEFGSEFSPLRLLIASDVASEGINLHYFCHKMIHFDIPWSLMLFQQRNGRIDRYGQPEKPAIGYLETQSSNEIIRGDHRILEVLMEKDEHARDNIGDPSEFLGCYDQKGEEDAVARAMAESDADAFSAELDARAAASHDVSDDADALDILALLDSFAPGAEGSTGAASSSAGSAAAPAVETASMPTLFRSTFDFCRCALEALGMEHTRSDAEQAFEIPLNEGAPHVRELLWRFRNMPREMRRVEGASGPVLRLSAQIPVVNRAIIEARHREDSWPAVQYLWELSPFVQWLSDAVTSSFRRNEAPVLAIPALGKGRSIYVVSGLCPNRKGNPVISEWFGIEVSGGAVKPETRTLEGIFGPLGLLNGRNVLPNTGASVDIAALEAWLPEVCETARLCMRRRAEAFAQALAPELQAQLDRLALLQERHLEQARLITGEDALSRGRRETSERRTNDLFSSYRQWIRETLFVEAEKPSLRVAAVLTGI